MGNIQYRYVAGLFAGVVGACTPGVPERPAALDIEVPSVWQSGPEGEVGAASINEDWLKSLASPALLAVVNEALTGNRDLAATAARLRQAEAQAVIAGAPRLPTFGASLVAQRVQNRFTGPTGETASVRQSNYQVAGQLSWEADVWGRLAAQDAAGAADVAAATEDLVAAQLSLVAQVAQAWFGLVTARKQEELAEHTVASFVRSNGIVRSRYERGITTALDVRLANSNLASARALLARRRGEVEQSQRALEVLTGRYPQAAAQDDGALPSPPGPVPAGLPSDLLSRRPDIRAAQERLVAADYRVAGARRALLPQFTLTATAGQRAENFTRFLKFDDLIYTLAGNLTQPIFQGGRLVANVDLEKARRDERLANYARTLLTAFQEVENALAGEDYLAEQEGHQAQAAEEAAAAEALAEQQYSRGLAPILNLLDAQRRNFDAQGQYLDIRRARLANRVQLYLALGGGFAMPPSDGQTMQVGQ